MPLFRALAKNMAPMTNADELKILQGHVAPEVKSRLYENTEVRCNNALFFKTLYTADESST